MLGLKTLDVLDMTVKSIDPTKRLDDYYDIIDIKDPKIYNLIAKGETDGIFQLESDLFKNAIKSLVPDNINDINALTSYNRPGPLSAGMDKAYNNRKHGLEKAIEPLPNTWDIVKDSYGTIIYQEQCMLIAQKVAGFDDNQADSFLRKSLAKKKRALIDLCNQWFIYGKVNEEPPVDYDENNHNQVMYDPLAKYGAPIKGGIANGYNEQDLIAYCKDLEGYASYLSK